MMYTPEKSRQNDCNRVIFAAFRLLNKPLVPKIHLFLFCKSFAVHLFRIKSDHKDSRI